MKPTKFQTITLSILSVIGVVGMMVIVFWAAGK